jgi:hypothetical protein
MKSTGSVQSLRVGSGMIQVAIIWLVLLAGWIGGGLSAFGQIHGLAVGDQPSDWTSVRDSPGRTGREDRRPVIPGYEVSG